MTRRISAGVTSSLFPGEAEVARRFGQEPSDWKTKVKRVLENQAVPELVMASVYCHHLDRRH